MNVSAADIELSVGNALPDNVAGPWHVKASQRGDGVWELELRHEASNGLVIDTGEVDATEAIARAVESLAASREIANRVMPWR